MIAFLPADLPDETPASRALRHEVRDFLAGELATGAISARCDSWLGGHDPAFSRRLGERGWIGMTLPEEYGGGGRAAVDRFVVAEELLAAGAPVAAHWIADRQTAPLLLRYGTEEQRQSLLPAIACGECYFSIGMSEPDSGSDLASIRTKALKVDGGWLVNGRKVWTSHANHSHFMLTLCRTSVTEERHQGLSQLLIDLAAPGVTVRPIRLLTGAEHFCEVITTDVFVPDERLVGTEGRGWQQVTSELAFERSGPERILSTFPLLSELAVVLGPDPGPVAERVLGRLLARLHALRLLSRSVAHAIDAGSTPGAEAAMVKDLGTQFELSVIDAARTLVDPESAPAALRDRLAEAVMHSPGFTLRGGTSEILRGVVARELIRR